MVIQLNGTLWDAIAEHEVETAALIKEAVATAFAQLGDDVFKLDWSYHPKQLAKAA